MSASCCGVGFPVCFSAAVSSIHTILCTKSTPLSGRGHDFLPVLCVYACFCAFPCIRNSPFSFSVESTRCKSLLSGVLCTYFPFLCWRCPSKQTLGFSQSGAFSEAWLYPPVRVHVYSGVYSYSGEGVKKTPPALVLLRCLVSVVVNKRGFFPFVSFFFCFGVRAWREFVVVFLECFFVCFHDTGFVLRFLECLPWRQKILFSLFILFAHRADRCGLYAVLLLHCITFIIKEAAWGQISN